MNDKLIKKLKRKVIILEEMIETETRKLFVEKEKVLNYSKYISTVINSVNSVIVAINEQGSVEFINQLALDRFSLNEQLVKNKTIRDILGDYLVDELISKEKAGFSKVEIKIGEYDYLASRIPYIPEGFNKKGYIYFLVDISSLKEQEKIIEKQRVLLVQNAQLASLGELASGVAHEVNNPVSIIEGQLRRLKDFIKDKDISIDDEILLIDKIQNNLNRVISIISGMKRISRSGEGDSIEVVSIDKIFDSLKDLCHEKLKSNMITLSIFEQESELFVQVKETQFLQALYSIVINSSEAISSLDNKWIKVKVENDTNFIAIRIIDSGEGIDNEITKKMFNPFFSTKDIGEGTGIGLSIARQMIEDQGGSLYYEIYEGNTSFVIKIKKALNL